MASLSGRLGSESHKGNCKGKIPALPALETRPWVYPLDQTKRMFLISEAKGTEKQGILETSQRWEQQQGHQPREHHPNQLLPEA